MESIGRGDRLRSIVGRGDQIRRPGSVGILPAAFIILHFSFFIGSIEPQGIGQKLSNPQNNFSGKVRVPARGRVRESVANRSEIQCKGRGGMFGREYEQFLFNVIVDRD